MVSRLQPNEFAGLTDSDRNTFIRYWRLIVLHLLRPLLGVPVFVFAVNIQAAHLDSDLVRLHYDLELAGYCSLTTSKATQGFHAELQRVMTARSLGQTDLENARMQAWKEVHLEWQNRGLGGFRAWCKNEGRDAVNRLESVVSTESE